MPQEENPGRDLPAGRRLGAAGDRRRCGRGAAGLLRRGSAAGRGRSGPAPLSGARSERARCRAGARLGRRAGAPAPLSRPGRPCARAAARQDGADDLRRDRADAGGRRWAQAGSPALPRTSIPPSSRDAAARAYDHCSAPEEVPVAEALALLMREKLTGRHLPQSARPRGRPVAPLVRDQGARHTAQLARAMHDQTEFATVRGTSSGTWTCPTRTPKTPTTPRTSRAPNRPTTTTPASRAMPSARDEMDADSDREADADASEDSDAQDAADEDADASMSEGEDDDEEAGAGGASIPETGRGGRRSRPTRRSRPRSTRSSTPPTSATRKSWRACATSSTSSSPSFTASSAGLPTGCSGACSRARRARGSSTWKRGCWIPRGSPASSPTRFTRSPTRWRRRPPSGIRR